VWLLLAGLAWGQDLSDTPVEALTLRFDTRYDVIDWGRDAHRLQNSALVAFQVDLVAGLDLAGMASTGPRFTSRWSTWHDLKGGEPQRMALSLRQLYLQRWLGPVRIQAGSLPPVKGQVSTSGLEDLGWIDGVRVELHRPSGFVIEAVGGALTDVDEPDLFIRRRRLDYAELEVGHPLPAGLSMEAATHLLDDGVYVKAELGFERFDDVGRGVELRAESGVEARGGGVLAVVGGRTDLGAWMGGSGRFRGRVELSGLCRHVSASYGLFGALSEDFYQFGTECRARLDADLDRQGRLGLSLRYIGPVSQGLAARFDASLTARLRLRRDPDRGEGGEAEEG